MDSKLIKTAALAFLLPMTVFAKPELTLETVAGVNPAESAIQRTSKEVCMGLIRRKVMFPSTITWSSIIVAGPIDGGDMLVEINYEAKNVYGAALPYGAACAFSQSNDVCSRARRYPSGCGGVITFPR